MVLIKLRKILRVGLVLSLLWVVGKVAYESTVIVGQADSVYTSNFLWCSQLKGQHGAPADGGGGDCTSAASSLRKVYLEQRLKAIAAYSVVPVLGFWVAVWTLLLIVRGAHRWVTEDKT